MKMSTLSSLLVLLSVISMIAIAPNAFADHHEVTIEAVSGSGMDQECDATDNCWSPGRAVSVDVGGEITFLNTDNVPHSLSSGSTAAATDYWPIKLVMAPMDGNVQSQSFTLDSAGEYPFYCMVHPWMIGTITVEAAGAAEAEAAEAEAAEAEAAEAEAAEAEAAEAEAAEAEAAEAEAAEAIAAQEAAIAEAAEAEAAAAEAIAAQEAAIAEAEAAAEAAAEAMAAPAIDAADYISTSGAPVTSITANADDDSVIIAIDAADDGVLSVTLHSEVITAFDDGTYFVLIDNEEVEFEQSGSNLTIPYGAGNERVEIVGSHVVPEFGTIAMIILAVALVSIIAITAKTRTTLIPKL